MQMWDVQTGQIQHERGTGKVSQGSGVGADRAPGGEFMPVAWKPLVGASQRWAGGVGACALCPQRRGWYAVPQLLSWCTIHTACFDIVINP